MLTLFSDFSFVFHINARCILYPNLFKLIKYMEEESFYINFLSSNDGKKYSKFISDSVLVTKWKSKNVQDSRGPPSHWHIELGRTPGFLETTCPADTHAMLTARCSCHHDSSFPLHLVNVAHSTVAYILLKLKFSI